MSTVLLGLCHPKSPSSIECLLLQLKSENNSFPPAPRYVNQAATQPIIPLRQESKIATQEQCEAIALHFLVLSPIGPQGLYYCSEQALQSVPVILVRH